MIDGNKITSSLIGFVIIFIAINLVMIFFGIVVFGNSHDSVLDQKKSTIHYNKTEILE